MGKYSCMFSLTFLLLHFQPSDMSEAYLWKIVIDILTEPTPRQKLSHVNTVDDVVELLQKSKNIIVLTGAGVRSSLIH